MKRYIDADKMIHDTQMMKRYVADAILIDGIIKYINENLMVLDEDVQNLKRYGEWKATIDISTKKCSACLGLVSQPSSKRLFSYCPNCGAKMDDDYDQE